MADENDDNDDNEANVNDLGSPSPNDNNDEPFVGTQWIDEESIAAANARAREEGTTNGYHIQCSCQLVGPRI